MAKDFTKTAGARKIAKVMEKSEKKANELARLTESIENLLPCEYNDAIYDMDEGELEYLTQGIKDEGFHSSVTVCRLSDTPEGKYIILSGHRRIAAAKKSGEKNVPIIVKPVRDKVEMLEILISSNRKNRGDRPMTHAREIKHYRDIIAPARGIKKDVRKFIAEKMNMAESQVQRYEALLKLIPELQELADNPHYSFSALSKAAQFEEDEQYILLSKIRDYSTYYQEEEKYPTRKDIDGMINEIKEAKKNGTEVDDKYHEIKEQKITSVNETDAHEDIGAGIPMPKPVEKEENEETSDSEEKAVTHKEKEDDSFELSDNQNENDEFFNSDEEDDEDENYDYSQAPVELMLMSVHGSLDTALYSGHYTYDNVEDIDEWLMNIEKLIQSIREKIHPSIEE